MTLDTAPIPVAAMPRSPEWYELRHMKLGGSDIAAVLGLSSYQSKFSLWWRKKGLVAEQPDNKLMDWGRRLEPAIFQKFTESYADPDEWLAAPGSFLHPDRSWMLASPDGLHIDGTELIEVKTAQADLEWGDPPDGDIPIGYRCQAIWNMTVLGAQRCWIPVLIRGWDYREYLIEMDEAAQLDAAVLIEAGEQFIQSLINDHEPDIDGSDATYHVLRERHPDIEPGEVIIDDALRDAFLEAAVAKREVQDIWNLSASEILAQMGKSRNAVDSDGNMFAFRSPTQGDHPPYLRANNRIVKAMRPRRTITLNKETA